MDVGVAVAVAVDVDVQHRFSPEIPQSSSPSSSPGCIPVWHANFLSAGSTVGHDGVHSGLTSGTPAPMDGTLIETMCPPPLTMMTAISSFFISTAPRPLKDTVSTVHGILRRRHLLGSAARTFYSYLGVAANESRASIFRPNSI